MPQLRRQLNPDVPTTGPSATGGLRAQFQTPPSRQTPSNLGRHAPSGPQDITPEPAAALAHPAAQSNFFSIFGRPRLEQHPVVDEEDEDVSDDDFDPNAQDMESDEEFEEDPIPDQLGPEELEDSEVVDDDLDEELQDIDEADQEDDDDQDEEMHDRGSSRLSLPHYCDILTNTHLREIPVTPPTQSP